MIYPTLPVGSKVRLKSGGPEMTVEKIISGDTVWCAWWETPSTLSFHIFLLPCLTVISKP